MNRHSTREAAFQIIFQFDINDIEPQQAIEHFLETTEYDPFLTTIVGGVKTHKTEIDDAIAVHLDTWTIDRIASVEKTILRIAVFEIMFMPDMPKKVSIDEAVELAKTFGDDQSGKFINGVLKKFIT